MHPSPARSDVIRKLPRARGCVSCFTPAIFLAEAAPLGALAKRKETTPSEQADPKFMGDGRFRSFRLARNSRDCPRIAQLCHRAPRSHPSTRFRNASILAVAELKRSFGNSVKPWGPPG